MDGREAAGLLRELADLAEAGSVASGDVQRRQIERAFRICLRETGLAPKPMAARAWLPEEEQRLFKSYTEGIPMSAICADHDRSERSIETRISILLKAKK